MEFRTIKIDIMATETHCTDKGTHNRCPYMKETYMSNQVCKIFDKHLEYDKEAEAYKRLGSCAFKEKNK